MESLKYEKDKLEDELKNVNTREFNNTILHNDNNHNN